MEPQLLTIPASLAGTRLDKALSSLCPDLSRTRLKALIEEGHVVCEDEETSPLPLTRKVNEGETYLLSLPPAKPAAPRAQDLPLEVIYEDDHLIVLNKPAGIAVHPGAGMWEGTLVNALLHHCNGSLSGIGGVERPGIVHRIDKETSGLLVVAKNDRTHRGLAELFAAHDI